MSAGIKAAAIWFFSDSGVLLGYFTLSLKVLFFSKDTSKNAIRRIDGFSKAVQAAPLILIGQLGKDMNLAKALSGSELLDMCLETVYQAQKLIGGRAVMLECHEMPKIIEFYKNNGFEVLQRDERDNYLQMVRLL